MKRQLLVFILCLLLLMFISTVSNSTLQDQLVARNNAKDDINRGFISIDCGTTDEYLDTNTGIWYQPDTYFVKTGTNKVLSPDKYIDNPYFGKQMNTLRSFPEGKRNCYILKPKQGKNNDYLIRAFFAYGNYDYKNLVPTFDIYVGVYYWDTISAAYFQSIPYVYTEINYTPSIDTIDVCLVNTGQGLPFISSLELRPLNNSVYQTVSTSLPQYLQGRYGIGILTKFTHWRFKDDVYDRIWNSYEAFANAITINGTIDVLSKVKNNAYNLPAEVLSTAIQLQNGSHALVFDMTYESRYQYYVNIHFLEFEQLPHGQKRVINITMDDEYTLSDSITLEYMKALAISQKNATSGYAKFSISLAAESDLPPILNALEIYRITPQANSPTDTGDVNAILEIKQIYDISRIDWQGDPCAPLNLVWTGLICSSENNPRIISMSLSSSNLAGLIAPPFVNLTRLEQLDLSNNELTGLLPEFLAELPNLKFLDLSGNKLTGSVPRALKEKLKSKTLQLSLDGNPGLCLRGSCQKRKFVVPLVSCIAVVIVVALCSLLSWRHIRKRRVITEFKTEGRAFSNSEILSITDNLKTIIGEGGFGKVYLGTLHYNTPVAVKLLSVSSKQGYKAFQSEVKLLMFLNHRNLVSLIGSCDEADVKALVYEYMDNGNLHQKLSEENPNALKWTERLQIAVDAAQGLDYLHNDCTPPIIHRDLKTSNILLNAKMQAKIADFGLSRAFACDNDNYLKTAFAGTPGYLDPQFRISKKSDIYSFGIILFELITGQPAIKQVSGEVIHLPHWVIPEIEKGEIQNIIDQRLEGKFSIASVQKAIEVAMLCISKLAAQRPDVSHVLAELKGCLALEITYGVDSLHLESILTDIYPR